ncbi:hypothetical protein L3Q82_013757, partial [Scortum barcoo]
ATTRRQASTSSGDVEEAVGGQQPSSRTATSAFVQGGTGGALPEPCKMTSSSLLKRIANTVQDVWHLPEKHQDWQIRHWRPVLFTDESRFTLSTCDRRDRGTEDEILRPLVRPYAGAVGPGFLLMQDNARPHVAGVCQQFLQDEGIDAMDWPARSPDLNPIEHIWDIMSRSIHQRNATLHHRLSRSWRMLLVQVWEEIPQETICHLIRSMPRRCREVIQALWRPHTLLSLILPH